MTAQQQSGVSTNISYAGNLSNEDLDRAKELNDAKEKFRADLAGVDVEKDPISLNVTFGHKSVSAELVTDNSGREHLKLKSGESIEAFYERAIGAVKQLASGLMTEEERKIQNIRSTDDFIRPILSSLLQGDFKYVQPTEIGPTAQLYGRCGAGSYVVIGGEPYRVKRLTKIGRPEDVYFEIYQQVEDSYQRLSMSVLMDDPQDPGFSSISVELSEVYCNLVDIARAEPDKFEKPVDKLGKRIVQVMNELKKIEAFSGKPGTDLDPVI